MNVQKWLDELVTKKKTHLGKSSVTMKDLMNKFYETDQLSDLICDEYSKVSGTKKKCSFDTEQSLLSLPTQLRISLVRTVLTLKQ